MPDRPRVCMPTVRYTVPQHTTLSAGFEAVTRIDARDGWAVGVIGELPYGRALIARWDGRRWAPVPAPPSAYPVRLVNVSALSTHDAWAVGSYSNAHELPLVIHWDGQRWQRVSSPAIASGKFTGVAALAANNVWAVGVGSIRTSGSEALLEHWDGQRWRLVPIAGVPQYADLSAIAASSPRNVWAVGERLDDYGTALVAHYDGRRWRAMGGLSDPRVQTDLSAVAAISPSDVWAAGNVGDGVTPYHKIIEHWDGRGWRFVADAPDPRDDPPTLYSLAYRATDDVWAAGLQFAERWDGRRWQQVPTPAGDFIYGAASAGAGRALLAGSTAPAAGSTQSVPLVERITSAPCKSAG